MPEEISVSVIDAGDKGAIRELGAAIKEALGEQGKGRLPGVSAEWFGAKAAEAINEAMAGVDLFELIGSAWTTAGVLRDRADPARYPPDKAQYVKLGQHTIDLEIKPRLVVSIGPWASKPIELSMGMSAIVNAMELKIKSGHIESICGGTCDIGVSIALGGRPIVKRKSLKTIKLDAEHRFKAPGLNLSGRKPSQIDATPAANPPKA